MKVFNSGVGEATMGAAKDRLMARDRRRYCTGKPPPISMVSFRAEGVGFGDEFGARRRWLVKWRRGWQVANRCERARREPEREEG